MVSGLYGGEEVLEGPWNYKGTKRARPNPEVGEEKIRTVSVERLNSDSRDKRGQHGTKVK